MMAALRYWKLIGLGLVCLLLAVQTVRLGHRTNQLERARIDLNECREGRKQDRAAYEQAQRDAAAKNKADVQRIVGEQDRNSDEVQADLRARIERLRSELRGKGSAPGGAPRSPGAGPDVQGSPGADGEAGVCLSPEELLRAAENEEKHDQLITLLERQLGIKR
jgi:hypothetical protein